MSTNQNKAVLKVKFQRDYRSQKGNVTFVYVVTGSPEALAEYERVQGEYARKDDAGQLLYFTTRAMGLSGEIIITPNDKIVPNMTELNMAASLSAQFGGNLGQEMAKLHAAKLTGIGTTDNAVPQQQPANTANPTDSGLGKM